MARDELEQSAPGGLGSRPAWRTVLMREAVMPRSALQDAARLQTTGPMTALQEAIRLQTTGPMTALQEAARLQTTGPMTALQEAIRLQTTGPMTALQEAIRQTVKISAVGIPTTVIAEGARSVLRSLQIAPETAGDALLASAAPLADDSLYVSLRDLAPAVADAVDAAAEAVVAKTPWYSHRVIRNGLARMVWLLMWAVWVAALLAPILTPAVDPVLGTAISGIGATAVNAMSAKGLNPESVRRRIAAADG